MSKLHSNQSVTRGTDSSILWIEDNYVHVKRYYDGKFFSHDIYDIEHLNCLHFHGDIKCGIFSNESWKTPIRDLENIEKWTYITERRNGNQ